MAAYPSVCTNEGSSVLDGFRIENISVNRKSDVIGAPIELGEKRFDNKVLQPVEVDVTGYVRSADYDRILEEMVRMWENRNYEFYAVFTRNGEELYNLCLQNLPMRETPEKYDLVYCTLNFKQVIITKKMQRSPANESDRRTRHGGMKGAK